MRTGTKLNDSGPYRNIFFASVTYNNDPAPFQGASAGWASSSVFRVVPAKVPPLAFSMYSSSILANRLDRQPRTKADRDMTLNTYETPG
jgi:hypothetical protein